MLATVLLFSVGSQASSIRAKKGGRPFESANILLRKVGEAPGRFLVLLTVACCGFSAHLPVVRLPSLTLDPFSNRHLSLLLKVDGLAS